MKCYIAEKPSLAAAIATGIGKHGKRKGFFQCETGDVVTWCFGHLLEQAPPEAYNPDWQRWSLESLPMIPAKWKLLPKADDGAKAQLKVIKELLGQATEIVNAGDPDREGQLLVDEVLEYFGNRKPVKRIWLAALDPKSVAKALAGISDNAKYRSLKDAAVARSRADWLIGLNITRLLTVLGRRQGVIASKEVLSQGRVQTATLKLVVDRDRAIEGFIPKDFFLPSATVRHELGDFRSTWSPSDDAPGLDEERRLVDERVAQQLVTQTTGQHGHVTSASEHQKSEPPPLPYSLSKLQQAASASFGMKAAEVLATAQSLYEKRVTTYPRSDCRYLPEEQFDEAGAILTMLASAGFPAAAKANSTLKAPAWSTAKVTAHHAIIPTGVKPAGLTESESRIYGLVANAFICLFFAPHRYLERQVVVRIAGQDWKAVGRQDLDRGWKGALADVEKEEEAETSKVPAGLRQGDDVACLMVNLDRKTTTPPKHFDEGALIIAMENVHRYVTDAKIKRLLREKAGIGTEATRAGVIETLKRRGYVASKGKYLLSTALGQGLIDTVPPPLKDPGLTALWESAFSDIVENKRTLPAFMQYLEEATANFVKICLACQFPKSLLAQTELHPCPICGQPLLKLKSKTNAGFFWACFNEAHQALFLPDASGKPGKREPQVAAVKAPCPEPGCGKSLRRLESKKRSGTYFWGCENRDHPLREDQDGSPGAILVFKKK